MAGNPQTGNSYELLGMELYDVNHQRHSNPPSLNSSASSYAVTFAGEFHDEAGEPLVHHVAGPYDRHDELTNGLESSTKPTWKRRYRFTSWKVGVMTAFALSTTVLVTNSVLTVWASVYFRLEDGRRIGTAYDGDCDTVASRSLWLHIFINILSSMLLSASNYTMQCATAPTRQKCDLAHARGDWLDVGVLSVRNLTRVAWQRRFIWALLALSSTPIHLLYNSAVFKTTDDNDYSAFLSGSDFLDVEYSTSGSVKELHHSYLADPSSFAQLSPRDCILEYTTWTLSGRSDVIVVLANRSDVVAHEIGGSSRPKTGLPFSWICPGCKTMSEARDQDRIEDWKLNSSTVDFCLSKIVPSHCKLLFSVEILIAVIVCNAIKCIAMIWLVRGQRTPTFVTFGYALSSWLTEPDAATKDGPSASMKTIKQGVRNMETPRPLDSSCMAAISVKRWALAMFICLLSVAASSTGLALVVSALIEATDDNIISAGFGTVNTNMAFFRSGDLASAVVIANTPQMIWSFVYLSYNALLTNMHLTHELSAYKAHRKPLRVTTPYGQQRKTYWLQLPFTYGIPLMITSALVHWLISQAVFLVHVEGSETQGIVSPAPMLIILVITIGMMLLAIGLGFRKLKGGPMPVAASCSFALAAAAHRPEDDVDAAVLPVRWSMVFDGAKDVGHGCFTSQEVEEVLQTSTAMSENEGESPAVRRRLMKQQFHGNT